MGPSIRSGPTFCPRITIVESQEILVSSGTIKGIKVKVDNIAVSRTYVIRFLNLLIAERHTLTRVVSLDNNINEAVYDIIHDT